MKRRPSSRARAVVLLAIVLFAIGVFALARAALGIAFANHLQPELAVVGRDPSGRSVGEATPTVARAGPDALQVMAQRVLERKVTLIDGSDRWPIDGAALGQPIPVPGDPPNLTISPAALGAAIAATGRPVTVPPHDATLVIANGAALIDEERIGRALDVDATEAALRDAFLRDDTSDQAGSPPEVALVWHPIVPSVRTEQLKPLAAQTQEALDRGLALRADERTLSLTGAELGDLLAVTRDPSGRVIVEIDRSKISGVVERFRRDFNRTEPIVRVTRVDGKVKLLRPALPARTLDESAAITAIERGWRSGDTELPAIATPAVVDDAALARLGQELRDVIAEGQSSYAGSIPDRAHNVELAASNLDGTLVEPGKMFSFDDAVGPTTVDAGFRWGFAIVGDGPAHRTIPSVAGGICQVATTVFQPVFWAGYQIDERHWHDYWIDRYRVQSYPGLDATVDPDGGIDLKFTNDTSHPLLIHSWTGGGTIHVQLVGTKPDWTVKVDPARVTDVVRAPTGTIQSSSPRFPKGTTIVTQASQDGFKVAIDRHVTYSTGRVRDLHLRETYAPVQSEVLTGTGVPG